MSNKDVEKAEELLDSYGRTEVTIEIAKTHALIAIAKSLEYISGDLREISCFLDEIRLKP